MRELVRLFLMFAIAALAATLIGAAIAWWMEEQRRMARLARKVLGGEPDGLIVAQGRGAAAAFRLETGKVLVMRKNGAFALLYPLALLLGAELLVDQQVVARVAQGEPKLPLDRIPAQAEHVALRLIFDDARHPDFVLDLWRPGDARRRQNLPAPMVVQEARGWLTRAEAIMRRRPAISAISDIPPSAPHRDHTFDWDSDGEADFEDTPDYDEPEAPGAHADPAHADDAPGGTGQMRLF